MRSHAERGMVISKSRRIKTSCSYFTIFYRCGFFGSCRGFSPFRHPRPAHRYSIIVSLLTTLISYHQENRIKVAICGTAGARRESLYPRHPHDNTQCLYMKQHLCIICRLFFYFFNIAAFQLCDFFGYKRDVFWFIALSPVRNRRKKRGVGFQQEF